MAQVSKVAVSRLVARNNDDEPEKRSRDDYRKAKELEEARKLGTVAAAVDEEGKDINPHIPQYISDAPWYLDPRGPTLKHQKQQEEKIKKYSDISEWYNRGVDTTKVATKYRKGACENCGAMTHKKRDCLERPRKIGAKYSGANFAPDESLQPNLAHDFDGKRDRWNGYNPDEHREVIEEFKKLDEVKKEVKKNKLKGGLGNPEEDDGANSSEEDDEDKYADDMEMVGTKVDASERYTVRNLRIREDTAKYLRNLDLSSAHYDPKTRSMRCNPYDGTGKAKDEVDYAGDNYVRISGDTVSHAKDTMFAWEAARKGLDVHTLAEPTKLEALRKEYDTKKDEFKGVVKNSILEKYGGEEHLEAPPRELIFAQTEEYHEYSRHGKLLKGAESSTMKSKYEEDVKINNHPAVWGSYWSEGAWGFKCCHSLVKNSYCTGEAGKEVNQATLTLPPPTTARDDDDKEEDSVKEEEDSDEREEKRQKSLMELNKEKKRKEKNKKKKKKKQKKKKKKKRESSSSSSSSSSSESEDEEATKKKKLAEAMKRLEEKEKETERLMAMDVRKRPYNSYTEDVKAPTEEDMEAYYLKKRRRRRSG